MRYLHTMLRVRNLDVAMKFYQDALGLKEVRRVDNDKGRFTLVFLCAPEDEGLFKAAPQNRGAPLVELTYNWDEEKYGEDRHFGHLAYEVDDIYATCDHLMKMGITINRPPRDGNRNKRFLPALASRQEDQGGDDGTRNPVMAAGCAYPGDHSVVAVSGPLISRQQVQNRAPSFAWRGLIF